MPRTPAKPPSFEPGITLRGYLLELCTHAAADDDARFARALGGLWDECACFDTPVRPWHDLTVAPIGGCPSAVTGDELALFVGLMAGILADFKARPNASARSSSPPPPRPDTRQQLFRNDWEAFQKRLTSYAAR